MHHRAGGDDEQSLWIRLAAIRNRFVRWIGFVEVVHAHDAHKCANRQGAHAVLDSVALKTPQARPHAHEELSDLHARAARRHEVSDLVQEHRGQQAHHEHEDPDVRDSQRHQQGQ